MPSKGHDTLASRGAPPVTRHADLACYDTNPESFFPTAGVIPVKALATCRRCNHTAECLEWALDTGQHHGVWGATTPADRQRITIERRAAS